MKLLLDTQMIVWATVWPDLLPIQATQFIVDKNNEIYFSPINIWEVAIKSAKNLPGFKIDAKDLRSQLLEKKYQEVAINGFHATAVSDLPMLHKDPFDRLLLAQAIVENLVLLTSDTIIARYPAPVIFLPRQS